MRATLSPDHPSSPPPFSPHQPAAAPVTVRTDELTFMTLPPASFNLAMGCLSVRDRSRVAACSTKSAADMLALYKAVRIDGGKVMGDEKLANVFDLSDVKLTEAQLEQLMTGQLMPSGRWCQPTGVTFAGFGEPVDLNRQLPEHLVDVLSRLVVLRGRCNVEGPLEALVSRLPVDRIRVLDLAECYFLEGGSSWEETCYLMLPQGNI